MQNTATCSFTQYTVYTEAGATKDGPSAAQTDLILKHLSSEEEGSGP